jgi:glycerol-3-phosphate cytidylyltransferase-like family protein
VGVSSDELIAEYKGAPPVIPFEERMEIVQNVKGVDLAVRQTILTEIRQLQEHNGRHRHHRRRLERPLSRRTGVDEGAR